MADRGRLRALSVQQPWAWAILHAGKRVENRTWRPPPWLLGKRVLLHATRPRSLRDYHQAVRILRLATFGRVQVPKSYELERGGIVGVVRVSRGWVDLDGSLVGGVVAPEEVLAWHSPGQFGWLLDSVSPLPFQKCPGRLGLWEPPVEVWNQVRTRVGELSGL